MLSLYNLGHRVSAFEWRRYGLDMGPWNRIALNTRDTSYRISDDTEESWQDSLPLMMVFGS